MTSMTATEFLPRIPVIAPEHCPLCDSPITKKQFLEVESRIREQEKKKLEEQRRKLDEQNRVKMEAFRIETQNKAKVAADAQVFTITRERDAALAQAKAAQD